jgi:hypothetical protein
MGGLTTAGAIAAALLKRERTGETSVVDVSLLATALWQVSPLVIASKLFGFSKIPQGDRKQSFNPVVGTYRTADDRFISLILLQSDKHWDDFVRRLGVPEMATDPKFRDSTVRGENAAECIERLDEVFGSKPLAHWKEALDTFEGAPCAAGPWPTGTPSSSTGRRPGTPTATGRTGASSTCAPTPTYRSTQASPTSWWTCGCPASRSARSPRWRATGPSPRSSSAACGCRPTPSSARWAAGGPSPPASLSNERGGVANLYLNLRRKLDRLLAVTGPLDPAARDRVATRFVEVRVLELLCQRSLGAALAGRAPGPEGSVIKLAWAAAEQALADAAVDVLGLGALDGPWGVGLLSSRSLSIAGGTTEVNKSIVAERVLGLPREPGPR